MECIVSGTVCCSMHPEINFFSLLNKVYSGRNYYKIAEKTKVLRCESIVFVFTDKRP